MDTLSELSDERDYLDSLDDYSWMDLDKDVPSIGELMRKIELAKNSKHPEEAPAPLSVCKSCDILVHDNRFCPKCDGITDPVTSDEDI